MAVLEHILPPAAFTYAQLIKTLLTSLSVSSLPHFPNITTGLGSLLLVLLPCCVSDFSMTENLPYSLSEIFPSPKWQEAALLCLLFSEDSAIM